MSTTAADGAPIHMPDDRHELLSFHAIGATYGLTHSHQQSPLRRAFCERKRAVRAVRYCFRSQIRSHRRRAFLATTLLLICVM